MAWASSYTTTECANTPSLASLASLLFPVSPGTTSLEINDFDNILLVSMFLWRPRTVEKCIHVELIGIQSAGRKSGLSLSALATAVRQLLERLLLKLAQTVLELVEPAEVEVVNELGE